MKGFFTLVAALVFTLSASAAAKPLELREIQVVPIADSASDRPYELYIKLPEKYEENKDKDYPVIYYTDAMWHVELLSAATTFMLEDAILVGISWQKSDKDLNGSLRKERGEHVSRYRDYSIRPSSNPEQQARGRFGEATQHMAFIRNDVIKYVEKTYRAQPGNRTYFGYSMGGEFGTYILLTQPDLFQNYILGSPSVRGEVPYIAELVETVSARNVRFNANVFMSYGTLETEAKKHIDDLFSLLNRFEESGLSLELAVVEGDHAGAFPATGIQSIAWLKKLVGNGKQG